MYDSVISAYFHRIFGVYTIRLFFKCRIKLTCLYNVKLRQCFLQSRDSNHIYEMCQLIMHKCIQSTNKQWSWTFFAREYSYWEFLQTVLVRKVMRSVMSVHPSVCTLVFWTSSPLTLVFCVCRSWPYLGLRLVRMVNVRSDLKGSLFSSKCGFSRHVIRYWTHTTDHRASSKNFSLRDNTCNKYELSQMDQRDDLYVGWNRSTVSRQFLSNQKSARKCQEIRLLINWINIHNFILVKKA